MSSPPSSAAVTDAGVIENRRHRRYPVRLRLHYAVLKGSRVGDSGVGAIVNISSGGVLFEASDICHGMGPIELVIEWPTLPDRSLNLLMRGQVVRAEGRLVAVKVDKYEFDARNRQKSVDQE